jgi:hypothetical protein
MKRLLIAIALLGAVVAVGQNTKTPAKPETKAAEPVAISEASYLKMENLLLRMQIVRTQLQQLEQQYSTVTSGLCSDAKIAPEKCVVDLDKKELRVSVDPPASTTADPPKPSPKK